VTALSFENVITNLTPSRKFIINMWHRNRQSGSAIRVR
jgi:hypothetical protein